MTKIKNSDKTKYWQVYGDKLHLSNIADGNVKYYNQSETSSAISYKTKCTYYLTHRMHS